MPTASTTPGRRRDWSPRSTTRTWRSAHARAGPARCRWAGASRTRSRAEPWARSCTPGCRTRSARARPCERRPIRVRDGISHRRGARRVHDCRHPGAHDVRRAEPLSRGAGHGAGGPRHLATARRSVRLMRLLCTNDDGILAFGLECLAKAAAPLGEVTIVAPDREQSATSHSLTLHHPIRPVMRGEHRWQVDGTPTDCVMLAVEALMPERPDFVLSGINHGHNMGEDVLYSGTVAAAMEGVTLGIPAMALSFAGGELRADPQLLTDQIPAVAALLRHLTALPMPRDTLLNVNMPARRASEIRGVKLTR